MTRKKSQENNGTSNRKQTSKKALIVQSERKSRLPLIMIASLSVAILILAGILFFHGAGEGPTAVRSAKEFVYPVRLFETGDAKYYRYNTPDGKSIKYFVLKSSDGVLRAAFDACDVCWPAGKGYSQEGDFMVCRNCGRRFASVKVNEVRGGCNPAPLNRAISGDNLVIQVKDILAGKQYFDFSRRS